MKKSAQSLLLLIKGLLGLLLVIFMLSLFVLALVITQFGTDSTAKVPVVADAKNVPQPSVKKDQGLISRDDLWQAPDWNTVTAEPNAKQIQYGKELLVHTAEYLGPEGKVKKISNGLNCQNCHLEAGTLPLGNNFGAVASGYPKIRARSGQMEDIPKRINDCFERSLNGKALERDSEEMKAMVAYMLWLGKAVPKGTRPQGSGIYAVPLMERAADPILGKTVYDQQCASCHGSEGQGLAQASGKGYIYPPLWGSNSYNDGAGLYRLSRFAGFVKANMPLGARYERPLLSDEEAWDVAAYVNSMERPSKDKSVDWPDISKKPMDHPFGPFADPYSETQHKYGPFQPILTAKAEVK
ncbi:c-type cytochrome [Cyclobacterium plantarum]|uniref:C-type cytochrome n=1 Tax=Cyclobacterium plantarum TaxID=2716263 RepID=A0ABX0H4D6_9BACT|nr:c-type cytochrome [Cyclobacterium plantarum]NHE56699.1 c-type cytochrome [Cyclobacterium plantarum]